MRMGGGELGALRGSSILHTFFFHPWGGGGTYSERLLDFTARGYLPIPRPQPICREMGLRISRGGGGAPPARFL